MPLVRYARLIVTRISVETTKIESCREGASSHNHTCSGCAVLRAHGALQVLQYHTDCADLLSVSIRLLQLSGAQLREHKALLASHFHADADADALAGVRSVYAAFKYQQQ